MSRVLDGERDTCLAVYLELRGTNFDATEDLKPTTNLVFHQQSGAVRELTVTEYQSGYEENAIPVPFQKIHEQAQLEAV